MNKWWKKITCEEKKDTNFLARAASIARFTTSRDTINDFQDPWASIGKDQAEFWNEKNYNKK
jgi:hypothetical protein